MVVIVVGIFFGIYYVLPRTPIHPSCSTNSDCHQFGYDVCSQGKCYSTGALNPQDECKYQQNGVWNDMYNCCCPTDCIEHHIMTQERCECCWRL